MWLVQLHPMPIRWIPGNCAIGLKPGPPPDTSLMINNFWTQGFPAGSLTDPNNPLLYSIDPHLKTPMVQQWHFGLQYQLPGQTVLEVSYAGSHGQRLYGFYNGNQATPSTDPNAPLAPRRPFPAVDGSIDTLALQYILQLQLPASAPRKTPKPRLADSKCPTPTATPWMTPPAPAWARSTMVISAISASLQWSMGIPMLMSVTTSFWPMPTTCRSAKARRFAGNASGFLNQLIGNWQVAGITSASTGNWFTVSDPVREQFEHGLRRYGSVQLLAPKRDWRPQRQTLRARHVLQHLRLYQRSGSGHVWKRTQKRRARSRATRTGTSRWARLFRFANGCALSSVPTFSTSGTTRIS